MFTKDRYSNAFTLLSTGFVLSLVMFKFKTKIPAAIALLIGIIGMFYLLYLYFQKARLHLNPNQISATGVVQPIVNVIEVKTETGCKFSLDKQISNNGTLTNIDGIRIGATGKRYKAVNGVDIYLANNNLFYPIGFGSAIMQAIGQGGYEPPAIQNDTCWN